MLASVSKKAGTFYAITHEWSGRIQPIWTSGWVGLLLAITFLVSGGFLFAGAMGLGWFIEQSRREEDAERSGRRQIGGVPKWKDEAESKNRRAK
jgi:hypothetical protein